MGDEVLPIAVLVDELKDEDVQMRLNSIKRLSTIALALGEERTRSELIPFLSETVDTNEDEILLAISEELGRFVPLVGGAAHAHTLLAPLEKLARVEETVVREKAVESIQTVVQDMSPDQLDTHLLAVLQRLSGADWFASRASACGLFDCCYGRVSAASKAELRKMFTKLCGDETPMVRRAAATHLNKLVLKYSPEDISSEGYSQLLQLINDEQDTVRLLAAGSAVTFCEQLKQDEARDMILPHVQRCSKDRSWRVRYVIAEKWTSLQASLGASLCKTELVPMIVRLLQDQEAEVRTQACFRLPDIGTILSDVDRKVVVSTNVLPNVHELCSDNSAHVRVAIASVLLSIAPVLGKEKTTESLIPLYIKLLKDEFSDVRLSIISRLDKLQEVVGIDSVCSAIIPEIIALADDQQWRVRLALIEQIPSLAKNFPVEQFDQRLTPLTLNWLNDSIYAIRESATFIVRQLIEVYGLGWAKKSIVPHVAALGAEKPYLSRLTTLLLISSLTDVIDEDIATKDLLPIVLRLTKDGIPNVRFNAARALERLIPKVDKSVINRDVKPTLESMKQDTDADVKFFSTQALAVC